MKNLPTVNQNNKLMLKKSKSLMNITNNILSNDNWMRKLWKWADDNYIPDYCRYIIDGEECYWGGLPRTQEVLLNLTDFSHNSYSDNLDIFEKPSTFNDKLNIPKEIENLTNLTEIYILGPDLVVLPKEIGNLTKLKHLTLDNLFDIPKEIGSLINLTSLTIDNFKNDEEDKLVIPKEIGYLINLKSLYVWHADGIKLKIPREIGNLVNLTELNLSVREFNLPEEIIDLIELKTLHLDNNPNLILSEDQKSWIYKLIKNGCKITMDDDLLKRTFKNINPYQEKFNILVKKIYDRDYELGACFERNITFETFKDDQLTWNSVAEGEDKKMLITHWGLINMFVKDIFGNETKVSTYQ